jgi:hypothetical protein
MYQTTRTMEYVAMCEATKEVTWMRRLLSSIGATQLNPTKLLCDNQGAIRLVSNAEFHQRTKHIDVKFHYIREQYQNQIIAVDYVGTKDQLADVLTKALGGPVFQDMRKKIGVTEISV